MTLSDTASSILSATAAHPLGLAAPPAALPAAARDAVRRSLLKHGLAAECAVPDDQMVLGWRLPDGTWTAMRITEAGRQAVAAEAPFNSMPAAGSGGSLAASMAQKERELTSECTRAALAAARARSKALGGGRGYRPACDPDAAAAALARQQAAERAAHRLEVERLRAAGVVGQAALA